MSKGLETGKGVKEKKINVSKSVVRSSGEQEDKKLSTGHYDRFLLSGGGEVRKNVDQKNSLGKRAKENSMAARSVQKLRSDGGRMKTSRGQQTISASAAG